MSKAAEKNWGLVWSRENEMKAGVALQHLAEAVFLKWRREFNSEKYPNLVGLGQIHDIWNIMYQDMQAIYTLEKLVNDKYKARIVDDEFDPGTAEDDDDDEEEMEPEEEDAEEAEGPD